MKEIKNRIGYKKYISRIIGILFLGTIIEVLIKPFSLIGTVLIFVLLILIFFSGKYTNAISIDSLNISIHYFHFFFKREITIPLSEVSVEIKKKSEFRSPKYFTLTFLKNKKTIYELDNRDGFSEEDLIEIKKIVG